MLDEDANKDYALNELAYIQKLREIMWISQDLIWQLQVWMMIDTITSSYLCESEVIFNYWFAYITA